MALFLQLLTIGISMGMVYAFMSMGIILLVRAIGLLNFAHGSIFMAGAFIAYFFDTQMGMPFVLVLVCSLLTYIIGGIAFMFSVYWPLRKSSWPATVVISTLGASVVIREIVKLVWGPVPLPTQPLIKGTITLGATTIEYQYLAIIGIGIIAIVSIFVLFEKMYIGRVMQAAAQDSYAASLLGISSVLTTAITYAISVALAGLGGYLAAPLFLTSLTLGSMLQKAFAGIIIGGYGNIKGALVGSIIVGLIESFSVLITTTYRDALIFLVLLIVLVVRPRGLFGQLIDEKA